MPQPLRNGAVWLANLNPGKGTVPGKIRPVLIIQNQALLDAEHPSTLIIPLTTHLIDAARPLRLRVTARQDLGRDSDLLIDQIRAIDNRRLVSGPLAQLEVDFMSEVHEAVAEVMGIK